MMSKQSKPASNTDTKTAKVDTTFEQQLAELQQQLVAAQDGEKRALADYQNLVRRQHEERSHLVKMASREVIESLLEPLGHLNLAAAQLNDQGLQMVIDQFWSVLKDQGLSELEVMGKPFDVDTMEVAEKEGSGEVVIKVLRKGYSLYGQVIQHARVVMGEPSQL